MVSLPIGGERTIKFSTDVEDQYFDRVSDPGELQIGLLDLAPNEQKGRHSTWSAKESRCYPERHQVEST